MKSKYSTDAVAAFKKCYENTTSHKKYGLIKEQSLVANFWKFFGQKKIKIYSTRSETKAAVAERAIRSLKNIIYRSMEANGHEYLVKKGSFLNTMNSRLNRSTGKAPKEVKNKDFLPIFNKKSDQTIQKISV